MLLPSAHDAASWFVETARVAVASGARLDARAVQLLMMLAPGDAAIGKAIEALIDEPDTLAGYARDATARLREAARRRDENRAREIVTALEEQILRVYRPSHGLGDLETDAAAALALLAAYDVGADEAHLMMAEELMLGVVRRNWGERTRHDLAANCEAAIALATLAVVTDKAEYRERALEVVESYAETYREHGVGAAAYVSALQAIS